MGCIPTKAKETLAIEFALHALFVALVGQVASWMGLWSDRVQPLVIFFYNSTNSLTIHLTPEECEAGFKLEE